MLLSRLLLGCILAVAATSALAQLDSREAIALQNQILELRRDMQLMQGGRAAPPQPYRGGGAGGGSEIAAQLLDRVTLLEEEVRRLRGQVDEQANANRRLADELSKQVADLNFRLQNAGSSAQPPSGQAAASLPNPGGLAPSAGGRRPPELAMQEGNAALARRDYAAAEVAAREVLATGRTSPRAGDAQFLLAQALVGKRDYQGAAVAYDDAYNRSRTGSRAPEALLGLANALAGLNERPSACATLDRLRAEFPAPRTDIRDGAAAVRASAGCR